MNGDNIHMLDPGTNKRLPCNENKSFYLPLLPRIMLNGKHLPLELLNDLKGR